MTWHCPACGYDKFTMSHYTEHGRWYRRCLRCTWDTVVSATLYAHGVWLVMVPDQGEH